jgi:hypothetical protein
MKKILAAISMISTNMCFYQTAGANQPATMKTSLLYTTAQTSVSSSNAENENHHELKT